MQQFSHCCTNYLHRCFASFLQSFAKLFDNFIMLPSNYCQKIQRNMKAVVPTIGCIVLFGRVFETARPADLYELPPQLPLTSFDKANC